MAVNQALELGPYLLVDFARHGTDGLPHLQQLVEGSGDVVPLARVLRLLGGELGGFVDESLLGQQVVIELLLALFVVLLAPLVDAGGGVLEALPDFFVLLGGHGTYLLPLDTEILQPFEGLCHRGLHNELLGLLTERYLLVEVALLIQGAQLTVNLQLVEELFYLEVVVLPQVVHLVARHVADAFPALLYLVEAIQRGAHLFLLAVYQRAKFLNEGLFGRQVFLLLFL